MHCVTLATASHTLIVNLLLISFLLDLFCSLALSWPLMLPQRSRIKWLTGVEYKVVKVTRLKISGYLPATPVPFHCSYSSDGQGQSDWSCFLSQLLPFPKHPGPGITASQASGSRVGNFIHSKDFLWQVVFLCLHSPTVSTDSPVAPHQYFQAPHFHICVKNNSGTV